MFWAIGCNYPVPHIGTHILTKGGHWYGNFWVWTFHSAQNFWRVVPIVGSGQLDKVQKLYLYIIENQTGLEAQDYLIVELFAFLYKYHFVASPYNLSGNRTPCSLQVSNGLV